jgi:LmbE family N-acetylglucosaminyl deacetylase
MGRVLCLGAHSDDIEIGCGATVLALRDHLPDLALDWVVLSAVGARRDEAQASAERFAGSVALELRVEAFRERYFPHQPEIKEYFDQLGRGPRPDLVLVPRPDDAHQDHRVVAELARNTYRNELILHYEIPKYDGDLRPPNVFVPATERHVAEKVDLILTGFPSQQDRAWFDRRTFEGLMRIRGVECNAPSGFAEAFHASKIVFQPRMEDL